jgi:hypothetical protein
MPLTHRESINEGENTFQLQDKNKQIMNDTYWGTNVTDNKKVNK